MRFLGIIIFLSVCGCENSIAQNLSTRAQKYSEALIEFYKDEGIPSKQIKLDLVTTRKANRHYWGDVQVVKIGERFGFEFRDSDKVLRKFIDDPVFHALADSSNKTKPEPTQDVSQITDLSQNYLKLFQLDKLFDELSAPKTKFIVDPRLGRRFSDGYWSITFTRMFNGHRFLEDDITFHITEDGLLSGFFVYRISVFRGILGKPMGKDQAVNIAKKTLPVYLNCPLLRVLRNKQVKEVASLSAQLLILQPNNLLHKKRVRDIEKQNEAVLAWQIIEKVSFEEVGTTLYLTMWIDAISGDPLGGDFMPF